MSWISIAAKVTSLRKTAVILIMLVAARFASADTCKCGVPATAAFIFAQRPFDLVSDDYNVLGLLPVGQGLELYVVRHTCSGSQKVSDAFKSLDQGQNWEKTGAVFPVVFSRFYTVARSPSDPAVVYKQDDDGMLLRSDDSGLHWHRPKLDFNGDESIRSQLTQGRKLILLLAGIHPREPLTVFGTIEIGIHEKGPHEYERLIKVPGIYVSRDGGETWSLFSRQLRNYSVVAVSPSKPEIIVGVGEKGLVKSEDSGKSWHPVGQQEVIEAPADVGGLREVLAAHPDLDARSKADREQFLRGTLTWRNQEIYQIEFRADDADVFYVVSRKGIYRTADGGLTWCALNVGNNRLDFVNSLALNPDNENEIFVGTDEGVLKSVNGGCTFKKILDSHSAP